MAIKRGQIVKDDQENHFLVLDVVGTVANIESVATRELFTAPIAELFPSDRAAF